MGEKFPCSGCGACCKRVELAVRQYQHIDPEFIFPYGWDESGKCDQLGEDNRCLVYENRPIMCNIDQFCNARGLDKKEFYKVNIEACNELMDEQNIDKKLRIKQI